MLNYSFDSGIVTLHSHGLEIEVVLQASISTAINKATDEQSYTLGYCNKATDKQSYTLDYCQCPHQLKHQQ